MGLLKFIGHSMFMSAVFSLSVSVFAEELSDTDQEALQKTMELLKDRMQRQAVIDGNEKAKRTDVMARQLVGDGEDLDKLYEMAAEVFRDVATEEGGDSDKMQQKMGSAQKNPAAFLKNLSPAHQKMIKEMSEKIKERNQHINEIAP